MWSPATVHRKAMPRRRAALDYVLYAKPSESGTTTTPDPTVFFLDGRRRSPTIPVPLLLLSKRRASLCLSRELRNEHPASRVSLESRFGKVRVSSVLLLFGRGIFGSSLLFEH